MHDALPATSDRESLGEAIDALRHSSRGIVLLVLEALRGHEERETLDPTLGAPPTDAEFASALARNLALMTDHRVSLVQHSLTRDAAGRRLRVSPQAISEMLDRATLIGLKEGREWRIPAWQFDAGSLTGVLEGLPELAARFPGGIVSLSRWMVREHPDLDGRTPRAAMISGEIKAVLRLLDAL